MYKAEALECVFLEKDWRETSLEPSGLLPLLWLMGICLGKVRVRCFQLCYHVSEAPGASKSYYQNLIRTLSGPKSSLGNLNLSYPPTLPRHYPLPVQLFKRSSKEMPSQPHLTVLEKRDQFCWERQVLIPLFLPSKSPLPALSFFSGSWPSFTSFLWLRFMPVFPLTGKVLGNVSLKF